MKKKGTRELGVPRVIFVMTLRSSMTFEFLQSYRYGTLLCSSIFRSEVADFPDKYVRTERYANTQNTISTVTGRFPGIIPFAAKHIGRGEAWLSKNKFRDRSITILRTGISRRAQSRDTPLVRDWRAGLVGSA